MIFYVTDHSGKTHAYPSDRYCSRTSDGVLEVILVGEERRVVSQFCAPYCWWLTDPIGEKK